MALKPKEKMLGIAVGGLLSLIALYLLYSWISEEFTKRNAALAAVTKQVEDAEKKLQQSAKERAKLKELERRSLPTDRQLARSLYSNWLSKIVDDIGFPKPIDINSQQGRSSKDGGYEQYAVLINLTGSLEQLTRLMHAFYHVDYLHKITLISLKPADPKDKTAKQLSIQLKLEGLALQGAPRPDKLSDGVSTRLAEKDVATYKKTIADRNLFAAYVEPKPPAPPGPGPGPGTGEGPGTRPTRPIATDPIPFDAAKVARVTSILSKGAHSEAWLLVQSTGERLMLKEGDEFKVGTVSGKITKIGAREIEFQSKDGKHLSLPLGESLNAAQSVAIPNED